MLHRCPARSAVAKLAQRAEVVVNANQLVHGGEGEGVGAVGPNVAECAEVALGGGAGGADGKGTEGDRLELGVGRAVELPQ